MRLERRVVAYVIIALIVGAALALAVALAQGSDSVAGAAGSEGSAAMVQSGVYADDGEAATLAPADPARQEPLLDKFSAKDPFLPFGTASSGGGTSGGGTSGGTTSVLSAKVKVDGTSYNVKKGDQVPGGSAAAFTVSDVTSGDVSFTVNDGALENGDTSFSVNLGEVVEVTLKSGSTYTIAVSSIGDSGGGSSTGGHTITVLSVNSQNGVALATLKVDGKTYSDKKVGDVLTTSWGQIEILAIDVKAQTVTIMHGDQTLTLHAGQVIVK